MANSNMIGGLNINNAAESSPLCEGCAYGKIIVLPFQLMNESEPPVLENLSTRTYAVS
jgi:hypothetical protein